MPMPVKHFYIDPYSVKTVRACCALWGCGPRLGREERFTPRRTESGRRIKEYRPPRHSGDNLRHTDRHASGKKGNSKLLGLWTTVKGWFKSKRRNKVAPFIQVDPELDECFSEELMDTLDDLKDCVKSNNVRMSSRMSSRVSSCASSLSAVSNNDTLSLHADTSVWDSGSESDSASLCTTDSEISNSIHVSSPGSDSWIKEVDPFEYYDYDADDEADDEYDDKAYDVFTVQVVAWKKPVEDKGHFYEGMPGCVTY